MSDRLPPVMSGHDPLMLRTQLLEQVERRTVEAVAAVRTAQRAMAQPPVLLLGAAGLDVLTDVDDRYVELLSPSEVDAAAARVGIDLRELDDASQEQLRGYWTAIRGAAGEGHVMSQLADGTIPVPDGTDTAQLLDFTHPGSDIAFYGGDDLVTVANVKIASTADVIIEHFARYGDTVPVVYASSDAAAAAARHGFSVVDVASAPFGFDHPIVVDIGATSTDFDAAIMDEPTGTMSLDGDSIQEIPWFSITMIGVRAVRRLAKGATIAETSTELGHDVLRSGTAIAAGKTAVTLGGAEPTALAVSIAAGWTAHAALEVRRAWSQHGDADELWVRSVEALADTWSTSPLPL